MIQITAPAQEYLASLLESQDEDVIGIRIFITQAGTPKAETCIAYCRQDDVQDGDEKKEYDGFSAWLDGKSLPFLEDALVDYAKDRMGGQLTIKAPHSKMPRISEDSPLEDKVNYILYNEVNPSLAAHGGQVSLVELTENSVAVLRFGGGCQGCGMVDATLKDGVERTLREHIPELAGVSDVTDHSDKSNAYY